MTKYSENFNPFKTSLCIQHQKFFNFFRKSFRNISWHWQVIQILFQSFHKIVTRKDILKQCPYKVSKTSDLQQEEDYFYVSLSQLVVVKTMVYQLVCQHSVSDVMYLKDLYQKLCLLLYLKYNYLFIHIFPLEKHCGKKFIK